MEEGATYYRMQARPAPSSHGVIPSQQGHQQQPQVSSAPRLNRNSQEYLDRKACYQQFPVEWKKEINEEKDVNRRLAKFEEFRRRLRGEPPQHATQQPQQGGGAPGRQILTNRGGVQVVARNPMQQQHPSQQQHQGGEGYSQSPQQPPMLRRQVVVSDPNRASPVNSAIRMAPQQAAVVRGPGGARLLPARGPGGGPQLVRRVVAPSEDHPAAKRAKLTPSPPQQQQGYGSQQVYVKQEPQQQQQQQVVYVSQGQRVQSPNGTIYVQQQQPDGSVVLVPARERPRQQLVYVRASESQQGLRRQAGASPAASPAERKPSRSPPVLQQQQLQTQQHQPYQQGTSGQQQQLRGENHHQQYLQPSAGNPMHKSSSMPVFSNSSQMPVSPQVTAMRSPAPPGYGGPHSPLVQQQQAVPSPQQPPQQQMVPPQQKQMMQQQQGHPQLQQQHSQGTPQQMQQHQQQRVMRMHNDGPNKATPEYKEKLDKMRKRLLDDMQRILRRYRIDEVTPSQEFDFVISVLQMRRVIPIEKLDQVARAGAKCVEMNKLAFPLTEQIKDLARAGLKLQEGDLHLPDPWHQVRHKFLTLPPEVLKAIS